MIDIKKPLYKAIKIFSPCFVTHNRRCLVLYHCVSYNTLGYLPGNKSNRTTSNR